MGERSAPLDQAIKIGSLYIRVAQRRNRFVGEIVGEQKQYVRLVRWVAYRWRKTTCDAGHGARQQPKRLGKKVVHYAGTCCKSCGKNTMA